MGFLTAIAGIGTALIGKRSADKAADRQADANAAAIEASLMGFNYLRDSDLVNDTQTQGGQAGQQLGALLGLGGDQQAAQQAFQNYQNSTGFQFRMDQGMGAIEGSRAAQGMLNSGSTLRALNDYGQGMASQEFANYMGQLGAAQATGLNSAYQVASSGGAGGAQAANAGMTGAARINDINRTGTQDMVSGIGAAVGGLSDWWNNR